MNRIGIIAALASLIICSCQTPPPTLPTPASTAATTSQTPTTPQGHQLTSAEIRSVFVGNTSYTSGDYGPKTTSVYYGPDGHVTVLNVPGGKQVGTYKIKDNGVFCSMYPELRGGAETCQTIYSLGQDNYRWRLPYGSTYDEKVVPGNPDHL
ncbi:MAG TPA: hypothetical protein VFW75_04310 [Acetobacteraceae bacterium]|nr:hypothetical protein [Acetobacteraceae bacterium]